VTHFPLVPKSTDTVSVTARIRDEQPAGASTVTLFQRDHTSTSPGAFVGVPMFDDGAHGDGLAGDGVFGAQLTPAPNGTVVEFYVQATDATGNVRTWPAPVMEPNGSFAQVANALFQIDDEDITNPMPAFRVIMTGTERAAFPPGDRNSDAEANNTFISMDGDGTKVRYLCGVRVRGAGSRSQTPPNNRLNIPNDNRWNDLSAVNLNGLYVHSQIMGAAVSRKAGLLSSDARIIQYRINGANPARLTAPGGGSGSGYGAFIMLLPVGGDLMEEIYPDDGDGNVYRASTGNHNASLGYLGTNAVSYLNTGYFKASNGTENDWSDLMALTFALTQTNAPLEDYIQMVSTNVNVEMWMRYFAVGTLTCYGETSMFNGRGDDYALYRGLKDPRFSPIGHDFDTIFGQGDTTGSYTTTTNNSGNPTLFMMLNPPNNGGGGGGGFGGREANMPVLRRLLTNEVFVPVYFGELLRLCDTVFHPSELNPLFDQMLVRLGQRSDDRHDRRNEDLREQPSQCRSLAHPDESDRGHFAQCRERLPDRDRAERHALRNFTRRSHPQGAREWRRGAAFALGSALDEQRGPEPRHQSRAGAVDRCQRRGVCTADRGHPLRQRRGADRFRQPQRGHGVDGGGRALRSHGGAHRGQRRHAHDSAGRDGVVATGSEFHRGQWRSPARGRHGHGAHSFCECARLRELGRHHDQRRGELA
jgi:hypothetical protein